MRGSPARRSLARTTKSPCSQNPGRTLVVREQTCRTWRSIVLARKSCGAAWANRDGCNPAKRVASQASPSHTPTREAPVEGGFAGIVLAQNLRGQGATGMARVCRLQRSTRSCLSVDGCARAAAGLLTQGQGPRVETLAATCQTQVLSCLDK